MVAVSIEEIQARAETMRPGRFALTLVATPVVWLGWAFAIVSVVSWRAFRFVAAAFLTGMRLARGPSKAEQIDRLQAQVRDMSMQLSRFQG